VKILLDECVPRKLSKLLPGHEISTAPQAGLAGLENGKLLAAARSHNFELFLTVDRNLTFQQNISILPLNVLVLRCHSNKLDDLKSLVPQIIEFLSKPVVNQVTFIEG
jgi:predicted nuclease of predicted toxin-antitoxin system